MSVIIEHDGKRWLYCKGAPEVVLSLCTKTEHGGEAIALDEQGRQEVLKIQETMADGGLRVLAFAYRNLTSTDSPVEQELIFSGLMGLHDPRTYGSKNPGATNVLRSGSKAAAIVTLLLDGAKGWLPVMLVRWYGKSYGMEDGTLAMVGLAAFLGHLYPVFFRFQGGKGVATALGVLLGLNWMLGLATPLPP